jgi:PAS domain S-box-containing protein
LGRLPVAVKESLKKAQLAREREEAAERLRQSEERYRVISELTSDYAYSFRVEPDGALVLEWSTKQFEFIAGYTWDEIVARGGWLTLVHPDDVPRTKRHLEQLLAGHPQPALETRVFAKDGTIRWHRHFGRPVWDEKQWRVIRVYGAVQDITPLRRAT